LHHASVPFSAHKVVSANETDFQCGFCAFESSAPGVFPEKRLSLPEEFILPIIMKRITVISLLFILPCRGMAGEELCPGNRSALRKIGVKPFDPSLAGVYGSDEWKEKSRMPADRGRVSLPMTENK
jgi:hypothetical protein